MPDCRSIAFGANMRIGAMLAMQDSVLGAKPAA
jgi:hypothetical protein